MKTLALCFLVFASALPLFAQAPLSGYDVFEVVTDASVPTTAFKYESYITGKSIRGVRSLTPILTARDVAKLDIETREIGGAPCSGVTALFLPSAKAKLQPLLSRNKEAEVLIAINSTPRASFRVDKLIQLIEHSSTLFVIYQLETTKEYQDAEAMLKQIKSGQWKEPMKLDSPR